MLQVDEAISPLHSQDGQQNGSAQPLSAPLTDEMWRVSVINVIMFILSLHSAACLTVGDHITASSWKICPPSNKRHFILFVCMCLHLRVCSVSLRSSNWYLKLKCDMYVSYDGGIDKTHPPWCCHNNKYTLNDGGFMNDDRNKTFMTD